MNTHAHSYDQAPGTGERGRADGTGERRVGGTEPMESTDSSVCGESVAAAGNHDLQQRLATPRREICGRSWDKINVSDRRENWERGQITIMQRR